MKLQFLPPFSPALKCCSCQAGFKDQVSELLWPSSNLCTWWHFLNKWPISGDGTPCDFFAHCLLCCKGSLCLLCPLCPGLAHHLAVGLVKDSGHSAFFSTSEIRLIFTNMHYKWLLKALICYFKKLLIREISFSKNHNCLELTALNSGFDNFGVINASSVLGFKFILLLI